MIDNESWYTIEDFWFDFLGNECQEEDDDDWLPAWANE